MKVPLVYVSKDFTFEAAHKLNNYNGKCANLHGHTYKLRVTTKGPVHKNGLAIDFVDLKKIVEEKVLIRVDHTYLNDLISQPTAENIIVWMWQTLDKYLPLYELSLWETPTSWVTYQGKHKIYANK
ncbi:MAG: 6-carboxytetrahydropterin synthase QueD [Candidatus Gottesmanbacteria bacterium]|nr:6-carboxytetrahydropterin synthase QueD [Candidatus Gottesmanbacteria bacterium]